MNLNQTFEKIEAAKIIIKRNCYNAEDKAGIYILSRNEKSLENNVLIEKNFAYVGQSVHVLRRLAEHLIGYAQRIDLSLKTNARGLYSCDNLGGWKITCVYCKNEQLDTQEKFYFELYKSQGYEMYNKTGGGQGQGKVKVAEYKPPKTYTQGKAVGYEKARKEIAKLFDKYLNVCYLEKETKLSERAMIKFKNFLKGENEDENNTL